MWSISLRVTDYLRQRLYPQSYVIWVPSWAVIWILIRGRFIQSSSRGYGEAFKKFNSRKRNLSLLEQNSTFTRTRSFIPLLFKSFKKNEQKLNGQRSSLSGTFHLFVWLSKQSCSVNPFRLTFPHRWMSPAFEHHCLLEEEVLNKMKLFQREIEF